jgi:hypothetical protein
MGSTGGADQERAREGEDDSEKPEDRLTRCLAASCGCNEHEAADDDRRAGASDCDARADNKRNGNPNARLADSSTR